MKRVPRATPSMTGSMRRFFAYGSMGTAFD
jgi:hypothetical protein